MIQETEIGDQADDDCECGVIHETPEELPEALLRLGEVAAVRGGQQDGDQADDDCEYGVIHETPEKLPEALLRLGEVAVRGGQQDGDQADCE